MLLWRRKAVKGRYIFESKGTQSAHRTASNLRVVPNLRKAGDGKAGEGSGKGRFSILYLHNINLFKIQIFRTKYSEFFCSWLQVIENIDAYDAKTSKISDGNTASVKLIKWWRYGLR